MAKPIQYCKVKKNNNKKLKKYFNSHKKETDNLKFILIPLN